MPGFGFGFGFGSNQRGGLGLDATGPFALYLDFKNGVYRSGATKGALSTMPGYAYTRTGTAQFLDNAGAVQSFAANTPEVLSAIGYQPHLTFTNLLLNAGTNAVLVTQSVTVTAVAHTLSFIGTGSITLSGTATGTLTGTGASQQVALVFTPTAGSLTLTVSGDVRYANVGIGTFGAPYAPIVATTGVTAAIGATALKTNGSLPAGDFIIWGAVNLAGNPAGIIYPFSMWNGTTNERLYASINTAGTLSCAVFVGGVLQSIPANLATGGGTGRLVCMLRRNGGFYSTAVKKVDGTVVITADAASAGSVPAVTEMHYGELYNATSQAGRPLLGVYQRNGSFSNADITAILTAA